MELGLILAAADQAFDQVKQISAVTDDASAIMGSITGFASQLGELKRAILVDEVSELNSAYSGRQPPKTPTQRALEVYTAKVRVQQMERELYHMFLYGDLNHLGADGYREFCQIRQELEQQAEKDAQEESAWEISQEVDANFLRQFKIMISALFAAAASLMGLAQQVKDLFS
jgi:hypothetical protein